MFGPELFPRTPGASRLGLGTLLLAIACSLALIVAGIGKADAQSTPGNVASGATNAFSGTEANLSPQHLQALVGRIAIYPDDLLGLVLTASTQPLEIVEARRFSESRKTSPAAQPPMSWDPSVIALLNYPEVLKLMDADLAWTEQLGTSVIGQRAAVLDAIQTFRRQAYNAGNLRSNDKVTVSLSSDGATGSDSQDATISIASAVPQVVYVPNYDPAAIVAPAPSDDWPAYDWSPPYPYYGDPDAVFFPEIWFGGFIGFGFDWQDHEIFRGDDHRDHDMHRRLTPGTALRDRSIWQPDRSAVRRMETRSIARDPAGIPPAIASAGFGAARPSSVGRGLPEVVHGSAGMSGPSSVQVLHGPPAIHNGGAAPPHGVAGAGFAGPHFAGSRFAAPHFSGAPMGAPRAGMVARSGMAGGGFHAGGGHR